MISLVIPLYNEEDNVLIYPEELFPVVERLSKECDEQFEYIFVDDGSVDNTFNNLKALSHDFKGVKLVSHGENRGLGAAMKTGLMNTKGDFIIFIDADLTFRPENIKDLIIGYRISHADCVSGSPYIHEGHMKDVALHRLLISKTINGIYRLLLGENVTSISPIFRLYKSDSIKNLSITSNNFEINAEILAKLLINGKKVQEIPVPLYQRRYGVSKIQIKKEIINNIRLIYKIFKVKYLQKSWD